MSVILTLLTNKQITNNALRNLAPHVGHRNCARHVYCNWKKQFKGATLKNMFWNVVRCTYQEAWNHAVEK